MAVTIQPTGSSELYAGAGQVIGTAERAKEERARSERRTEQRSAENRAKEWELQKMEMRSQQDFAQELRDRQFEFDRMNAAKQWDIEKMRLASQFDFEADERKRIKEREESDNIYRHIQEQEEKGDKPDHAIAGLKLAWAQRGEKRGIPDPRIYEVLGAHEPAAYLTEDERREAALIHAGKLPRAAAERPPTKTVQDIEYQRFQRLDQLDKVISSFQPNAHTGGLFVRERDYELAVLDKDGKPIREATQSEKDLYALAVATKQQLLGGETEITREEYDKLPLGARYTYQGKPYIKGQ